MVKNKILIIDDDYLIREKLKQQLSIDYELTLVESGKQAIEVLKEHFFDIVLLDLYLIDMHGIDVLKKIKEIDNDANILVLTGSGNIDEMKSVISNGANDFITKPYDIDVLKNRINTLIEKIKLNKELVYFKEEIKKQHAHSSIVTQSDKMKKVLEIVDKVGTTFSTVLIFGESGTGKELIARAIHNNNESEKKPFVALNCGAIPQNLIESEFFGHEKGAFTGAIERKTGKFEFANGGVIFLDEISTLAMDMQVKLLRVLQEKTLERIGSNKTIKVNVQVVAATNVDLEEAVKEGTFREDLYYRLNVININLPPLRERKEDIPMLVNHFVNKHQHGRQNKKITISNEAMEVLIKYNWPGNIRELENLVERLYVLSPSGAIIDSSQIPLNSKDTSSEIIDSESDIIDLKEAVKKFEKKYILRVLKTTSWNKSKAARAMNVHRNTLLLKIKELKISKEEYFNRN